LVAFRKGGNKLRLKRNYNWVRESVKHNSIKKKSNKTKRGGKRNGGPKQNKAGERQGLKGESANDFPLGFLYGRGAPRWGLEAGGKKNMPIQWAKTKSHSLLGGGKGSSYCINFLPEGDVAQNFCGGDPSKESEKEKKDRNSRERIRNLNRSYGNFLLS